MVVAVTARRSQDSWPRQMRERRADSKRKRLLQQKDKHLHTKTAADLRWIFCPFEQQDKSHLAKANEEEAAEIKEEKTPAVSI